MHVQDASVGASTTLLANLIPDAYLSGLEKLLFAVLTAIITTAVSSLTRRILEGKRRK